MVPSHHRKRAPMLDYLVLVAVALSILGFVAWVIVLFALVFSWKLGQIVNQSQLAMAIWPLRGICLCFALATLPTKPLVSLVLVAPCSTLPPVCTNAFNRYMPITPMLCTAPSDESGRLAISTERTRLLIQPAETYLHRYVSALPIHTRR